MRKDVIALEPKERVGRLLDIIKNTRHHGTKRFFFGLRKFFNRKRCKIAKKLVRRQRLLGYKMAEKKFFGHQPGIARKKPPEDDSVVRAKAKISEMRVLSR
jgi:hypothetical protein